VGGGGKVTCEIVKVQWRDLVKTVVKLRVP
jgi:hypothetical protein